MPRQVPNWLLEAILGEKRVQSGAETKSGKRRKVLAREEVKKGRKDPGPKNPRGGRYLRDDVRAQLSQGPGESNPETIDDELARKIIYNEKQRDFNLEEYLAELEKRESKATAKQEKKDAEEEVQGKEEIDIEALIQELTK